MKSEITTAITEPGLYLDVPEADYHADPCPAPSLSSSVAKELIDRSALHARTLHPRLGDAPKRREAAHFDHGSLVHELLLGTGPGIEIVDAKDWKTKAAREERDAAREAGKTPVLKRQHEAAVVAVDALRQRLADRGIALAGESEVTMVWREAALDGDIWARGRLDHLDGRTIYDLKTITNAHPDACTRRIVDFGYDIQRAAYVRGLSTLRPDLGGRIEFVFIFVETDPPYGITARQLPGLMREHGERRWVEACERWSTALKTDRWHGYDPDAPYFDPPGWLLARMEE